MCEYKEGLRSCFAVGGVRESNRQAKAGTEQERPSRWRVNFDLTSPIAHIWSTCFQENDILTQIGRGSIVLLGVVPQHLCGGKTDTVSAGMYSHDCYQTAGCNLLELRRGRHDQALSR